MGTEGSSPTDPRHELGRAAEEAAASYLEACGFSLLARNVRVGRLEIDLVLRQEGLIVVAEVRARTAGALVKALDTVDWRKQRKVRRAGERLWLSRFKHDPSIERMRFDIVSVSFDPLTGSPHCEHVPAAF